MSQSSPAPLHLIPDAPISSPHFDRLDRMGFVRSFAEAIRAVKGEDSVVLALAGPWGSGKSSLLNLVAGELEKVPDEQRPLLVRFNPWWFTGTERLVAAFLQQLGAAFSRPEVRETLGDATAALERLALAIAEPGVVEDPEADPMMRDIEVLRDSVNSILRSSGRRIMIFMDDIDRLTPEEMTQLLLIVRAVADFPNTTYVLAFDHEVVSGAISEKLGVDGRTYLEKVVLLQIDVPLPGRMTLERMVVAQLEAIDPAAKSLDSKAQRDFRILFEGGVKHFLATPRACTRLLNVVRFTYPTLAGQVYFPDLLGISCLMSFCSQAIQAIRSYSDAFVGHCDPAGTGWLSLRQYHSAWISQVQERDRASVEAILRAMFPKFAWALNGPLRGQEYAETWDRQQRICSVKHFDTYFRLGLTAGEAAEHQWQNMVELLDDATAFARALQRFGPLEDGQGGAGGVVELLQRAADFLKEQATSDQARNLFQAIMRRGDQIAAVKDEDCERRMKFDPVHRVVSVLVDCLLQIDNPAQRREVLAKSVRTDAGLLTAAELLDVLDYRSDIFADKSSQAPAADENTSKLVEVLKVLDKRIQQASRSGELSRHALYMKVAQKWWQFGRKAASRKWVRETCESDERFVEALTQLLPAPVGPSSPKVVHAAYSLPLGFLVELFDRRELLERANQILDEQPDWLTPPGAATLELLDELLHGGRRARV